MEWHELFPKTREPELADVSAQIASPLWPALCEWLKQSCAASPTLMYSVCSGAPGWNLKFRKSSRAICTVYPHAGYFTCLVCIGGKEATDAELLLPTLSPGTQALYASVKPFNGSRWLMIDVTSRSVLDDVQKLIETRMKTGAKKRNL